MFVTSFWPLRLRVTSFWSFVTSPGVRFLPLAPGARGHPLYRHLLVVLASTRPFLLALRHYVLAPRRVCRFPVAISPGPSPGGPFLVSSRPTPTHASPYFIDLALPPGDALLPRPSPVFRFSGHEAAPAYQLQFPCSTVSWGRLKRCSRRREWRRRLRALVLKQTISHVTAPAVIARPREATNPHLVARYLPRVNR